MNPKFKLIEIIFSPLMELLEDKYRISSMVIPLFILLILFPLVMKKDSKKDSSIIIKIGLCIAILICLIDAIMFTLELRNI